MIYLISFFLFCDFAIHSGGIATEGFGGIGGIGGTTCTGVKGKPMIASAFSEQTRSAASEIRRTLFSCVETNTLFFLRRAEEFKWGGPGEGLPPLYSSKRTA